VSTWPRGPLGNVAPKLKLSATHHRGAGEDRLGDHLLHEPVRRPDVDAPGAHVTLVDDPSHAAVVVGMTVRVDDGHDRA
jgi:hypothetical protein